MKHDIQGEIFDALFSAADAMGFRYACFGTMSEAINERRRDGCPWLAVNYPDKWINRYLDQGYCDIDPVIQLNSSRVLTVNWDDLVAHRRDFFSEAAGFGLRSGVTIPIHTSNNHYFMCFASDHEGMVTPEVQARLNGLAFMVFQNWYQACPPSLVDYELSQKTLMILKMMDTEKTTTKIGQRIGMTKDGVAWHLKKARKKLDCQNTTQAYAKALSQGLFADLPSMEELFFGKKKI